MQLAWLPREWPSGTVSSLRPTKGRATRRRRDGPSATSREFGRFQLEAASWCDREGREGSLRTTELDPALGDWPTPAEFEALLQALRLRRRTLLGSFERKSSPPGRLLVCHLHESISSGESEAETSGFFDVNDRPPWDTWIWQFRGFEEGTVTLVSWVPSDLETVVSRGIAFNPYECGVMGWSAPPLPEWEPVRGGRDDEPAPHHRHRPR